MSIRTLTIPPFELPGGAQPPVTVRISLVDEDNRRIQGLTLAGQPVIDLVELSVSDTPVPVDLWPQSDLEPVLNLGSDADPVSSYYLVQIRHQPTRYLHVFRTQVADGGTLDWAEFVGGAGSPVGGQVPGWLGHISDGKIHVPAGGNMGDLLGKLTGADGDTTWIPPGSVGLPPQVTQPERTAGTETALRSFSPYDVADMAGIHGGGGGGVSDHGDLQGLADDDHLQYHTDARGDARYAPIAHPADTGNPHGVTKAQVGLGSVDNTSDADKPVSTLQQAAIDAKADQTALDGHTGAASPHSGHLIEVQEGAGIVVNTADPQRPIVSALGLNVLSENVPGTGEVWDDVNAHFFSGPDSDGNGRMCIGPSDIAYVGHQGIIYQYFGPQSVCIGAGGAGGIYPHRTTISTDWQATGSTDHQALTNRSAADAHPQSSITDLVSDLAGKETAGAAAAVQTNLDAHTGAVADAHPQGAITGLTSALAGKEPVISPKLTAFNRDFAGDGIATTVARSDHLHAGVYDPFGSAAAVQSDLSDHENAVVDAHPQGAITGLTAALAGKEPVISPKNTAFNRPFAGTGAADTVARADHTHDHADILNRDVDDSHPQSAITNLVADLAGKEPAFAKNSAFNRNFAGDGVADTVARSDHLHDSEYMRNLIDDTDPYAGGDIKIGGSNMWAAIFTDTLGVEQGSIGWSQTFAGVGLGWTPGGDFNQNDGGVLVRSGGVDIYGSEITIPVLKHLDQSGQQVYVSPDGALYGVDPPDSGWESPDTDTGSYDLGTGTGQGVWVEMTGLEASVVADVAAGDSIFVQAIVCAVNKTANRTGTISIGFGIGVGNPPTGGGVTMPIGAGQSGLLTPINIRDTSHGGLTAGTVIGIWARRETGSHNQFGVDMDGTVETHEMLLYVPGGGGGGGDPTNLSTSYSSTTFTINSSTGSNALVSEAIAGGDAGALSGARAQKVDDSITELSEDATPQLGGPLKGAGNTIDDYSNGYVNITGTSHTLQAADSGKVHTFNNAGAIALTLPDTLPAGFVATIIQLGAGAVQPSTAGGATLLNRQGHTETAGAGAMATLAVYSNPGNAAAYVMGGDTA